MSSNIKNILTPYILVLFIAISFTNEAYASNLDAHEKEALDPFEMANFYINHSKATINTNTGKKTIKQEFSNHVIGFEKPVYRNNIAYGFEVGVTSGVLYALDTLLILKLSAPFNLDSLGNIALITKGGVGISSLFYKEQLGPLHPRRAARFGIVNYFSFGLEYYPTEWVGISIESQLRDYKYIKDNKKSTKNVDGILLESSAFDINLDNIISVGLKITF